MDRRKAVGMESLVRDWLNRSPLGASLDLRRISCAWDEATGAGRYTTRIYFRGGKLYVTMSSSVARSQLLFQKRTIMEKINAILGGDGLYSASRTGENHIKELIIK